MLEILQKGAKDPVDQGGRREVWAENDMQLIFHYTGSLKFFKFQDEAFLIFKILNTFNYYMKLLQHVYFMILRFAYLATLNFCNFVKILYFESL